MSQIVTDRVEEILKKISTITKKLDWPDLPIYLNSPIGDFAVVCFPAAKTLKKSPAEIASEISLEIKKINKVLSAETEKGYCNVTIDWNDIVINVINRL